MSSTGTPQALVRDVQYEEQDLGPLAWVHAELRKTLDNAVKLLRHFAHEVESSGESDLTSHDAATLRNVRQMLHQCAGALVMVGMEQTALVLQAMEAAVHRLVQEPEQCRNEAVAVLESASFAVIEYLDSILAGKNVSPVALFPQYRQVQLLAGVPHVHPMDLWPAERRVREPIFPGAVLPLPYGSEVRSHLDTAVLRIVKNGDTEAAVDMQHLCMGFAAAQQETQPRILWKAAAGFFEAIARRWLPVDAYVKRTTSRVLMQYTALARGQTTLTDRLLPELLFFCAQARMPEDATGVTALRSVRHAWSLQRQAPVDYESARFGLCDPAMLAQARKRIAAATETWSALAGGDKHKIKLAADQFSLVCDSLRKLQLDSEPLAEALMRAVAVPLHAAQPPSPALAMEVATSVLYLQASFEELDAAREHMAERAKRLAGRLDGVTLGGESQPLEPWMEELYRRVSDHQTMGSVVGELRVTLADVEKSLDQFFRNPADTAPLATVPGGMQQMRGVLSVLGIDQASLAVLRMRDVIEKLLLGEIDEAERPRVFERLGNSLGALGFLVDMLGYQRAMAAKLFVYDEDLGELKIVMGSTTRTRVEDGPDEERLDLFIHAARAVVANRAGATVGAADSAETVDVDVVPSLVALPAARAAPSQPEEVHAALPVTQPEAAETAGPAPVDEPAPTSMTPVLLQPEPVPEPAVAAAPAAAMPAEVQEPDEELLDIFIEEAREVIANGLAAVASLQEEPGDLEQQTTLRRAFHTLKGSSRMVGLNEFGEAAWSMEQVLNDWLVHEKPVSADLRTLAHDALQAFGAWVQDLAQGQAQAWKARNFCEVADALRTQGVLLSWAHAGSHEAAPAALPAVDEAPAASMSAPAEEGAAAAHDSGFGFPDTVIEGLLEPEAPAQVPESESAPLLPDEFFAPMEQAPAAPPAVSADAHEAGEEEPAEHAPTQPAPLLPSIVEGDVRVIGHLRVPTALYNVYLSEAEDWSGRLVACVQEWADASRPVISEDAVAMAHSLAGSSATVGFTDLSQLARTLEHALQHLQLGGRTEPGDVRVLAGAVDEIRRLLHQFAAGFLKEPQPEVVDHLEALLQTDITSGAQALGAPSPEVEADLEATLIHKLQEWRDSQIGGLEHEDEHAPVYEGEQEAEQEEVLPVPHAEPLPQAAVAPLPQAVASPPQEEPAPLHADAFQQEQDIDQAIAQAIAADTDEDDIDAIDTIDPDLFPIFEEEALELLPTLGGALRQWFEQPSDLDARRELLRALHTLKGSARLAGALRLGEMAHRMESAVEGVDAEAATAADIDPLLARFDGLQATFDALRAIGMQAPQAAAAPAQAAASVQEAQAGAEAAPSAAAAGAACPGVVTKPRRFMPAWRAAPMIRASRP